jgi:GxxExxY protein
MTQLIHPELSYAVRGVLLDVYNKLGPGLKEEYYGEAIVIGFEKAKIQCESEKPFYVYYEKEQVGLYFVDVWIESGKILLELKVATAIEAIHKAQALSYLKVSDADLAIVANFGTSSLQDVRLPNYLRGKQSEFVWERHLPDNDWLYPDLTNSILRACHRVHAVLGPGFLHQVYRRAVMIELRRNNIEYEYIKQLPIEYQDHLLGYQEVRLILAAGKVLVTTFALRDMDAMLVEQLRARMRRLDMSLGLLANFYGTKLNVTPTRIK